MPRTSTFDEQLIELLPALRRFSRTLCSQPCDADDLIQETIAKALKSEHQYLPYGTLKSWLFTIMKNTFCSRLQKTRRETALNDWSGLALPASQDKAMELQDVGKAYQNIPEIYQKALRHVVLEGLSYQEAATAMNCTVGTVKSRLSRARTQLETALG
ncbi:ECF RNA polymerase sigma factor EcfG [Brucella sp. NBRC 13694]